MYKVGELARLAGVSVRTLHHYEERGLLVPPRRTDSGHRLYTRSDLERLVRIKALTALGFTLDEVRGCLTDEEWSPLRLVESHLERAREALDEQRALCERLERLRDDLRRGGDDVEQFIETLEVMTMIERYYTQEQLDELARRREEIGDEAIHEVESEWQALFAEVKAELDRGTPPEAPAAQALARRWRDLSGRTVAGFTGGDPGIKASLDRLYAEQPVERIHPSFDPAGVRLHEAGLRAARALTGASRGILLSVRGVRLELVVAAAGFALFAVMAAPGITWMDPGQLVAAAYNLGGAHPPGHPGHSLLGKLATLVPVGEIAFRVNLLSAMAAAAALAGVVALGRALAGPTWAALAAAAMCALSPVVQTNAVRAEVYAPVAALVVWSVLAAVRFARDGEARHALLAALGLGGAAAFHPVIAAAAALPIAIGLTWRARGRLLRVGPPFVGLTLFGLIAYAYLPVRALARHSPLLVWGDPTGIDALAGLVGARVYRGNIDPAGAGERLVSLVELAGDGAGAGLLAGGALGLALAIAGRMRWAWVPLAAAGGVLLGTAMQAAFNPDLAGYVLPALLAVAAGVAPLGARRIRAVGFAAVGIAALAALLAPSGRARDPGFQRDDSPLALWDETAARMPPGPGVYFAGGDHSLFALQYERLVAGARPDLAIASAELCRDEWFVRHLDRALPELFVPFVDDGMRGDIAERLAGENLRRGRPVGSDRPAVGRLPAFARPRGRGFALSLEPAGQGDPVRPPPIYPGDTGTRIARQIGIERALHEAERGRLADAARAAGFEIGGPGRARPERPAILPHIPRLSPVFLSEPWQLDLLADDLAWRAGLDVESGGASVPERRLHAAWRDLLAERGPPADALAAARAVLGDGAELASARMLDRVGRASAAEAILRDSIAARPGAPALLLLGSITGNRGTPDALDQAASLFARAAELAPGDAEPWVRLGIARAKQHRLADARAAWKRALALDPTRRDAAQLLARVGGQSAPPPGPSAAPGPTAATPPGQGAPAPDPSAAPPGPSAAPPGRSAAPPGPSAAPPPGPNAATPP